MEWHPFAERFPVMEGTEWQHFTESISKSNGPIEPITYRMVDGRQQGLDGRNRWLACKELKIDCPSREIQLADEDVAEYILRKNLDRRHLSSDMRRVFITELRAQGRSTRQIGETLGVSHQTVIRELTSTGPNVTVETVVGTDGKERKASTKILCDRCQRVGATAGCPACQDLNRKDKVAKPRGKREKVKEEVKDNHGNLVPKRCKDAWCDGWIQEAFDFLCVWGEKFRAQKLRQGMEKRKHKYPFFKAADFGGAMDWIVHYLDLATDHLKDMRPDGVCPACQGAGCAKCNTSGLVPRELYKKLRK